MNAKTIKEITPVWANEKIVYIAGKVTGLSFDEVQANFNNAQAEFEKQGYVVINPINLVHFEADWQQAMRICISFLPHADFVFLLDNYLDSRGALDELRIANLLGIPVLNTDVLVDEMNIYKISVDKEHCHVCHHSELEALKFYIAHTGCRLEDIGSIEKIERHQWHKSTVVDIETGDSNHGKSFAEIMLDKVRPDYISTSCW